MAKIITVAAAETITVAATAMKSIGAAIITIMAVAAVATKGLMATILAIITMAVVAMKGLMAIILTMITTAAVVKDHTAKTGQEADQKADQEAILIAVNPKPFKVDDVYGTLLSSR